MNLVVMMAVEIDAAEAAAGGGAVRWKYYWQGTKVHSEVTTNIYWLHAFRLFIMPIYLPVKVERAKRGKKSHVSSIC